MKRIWRPALYPPRIKGQQVISPYDLDAIYLEKLEYEKFEEDYLLYLHENKFLSRREDVDLDVGDYKHYVDTNIYYRRKSHQEKSNVENERCYTSNPEPIQKVQQPIDEDIAVGANETVLDFNITPTRSPWSQQQVKLNRVHKELFPEDTQGAPGSSPLSTSTMVLSDKNHNNRLTDFGSSEDVDNFQTDLKNQNTTTSKRKKGLSTWHLEDHSAIVEPYDEHISDQRSISGRSLSSSRHSLQLQQDAQTERRSIFNSPNPQSQFESSESMDLIEKVPQVARTRNRKTMKPIQCNPLTLSVHGDGFSQGPDPVTQETTNIAYNPFYKTANILHDGNLHGKSKSYSCEVNNDQPGKSAIPDFTDKKPTQGTVFNRVERVSGSKTLACSLSRKLVEHQKIRKEALQVSHKPKNAQEKKQKRRSSNAEPKQKKKIKKSKLDEGSGNLKKFQKEEYREEIRPEGKEGAVEENTEILYDTRYIDVIKLSSTERDELSTCLLNSDDISMTLLYNNGTTLLSTGHQQLENTKRKSLKSASKTIDKWVKGLALVIKGCISPIFKDQLIIFSFFTEDVDFLLWFKNCFSTVLKEKEIVTFDAQKIVVALIEVFELKDTEKKETECWRLKDPLLGTWLLDADKSPKLVHDVLNCVNIKPICKQTGNKETSWFIKATLLQMISATKKIAHKLMLQNMYKLFLVETALIPILACMETARIKIHMEKVNQFSSILKKKLSKLETEAFRSVGHSFLINSHPQLRQVLYEELQLDKKLPAKSKLVKTSVAHQKSTSESMLTQLTPYHPLPNIVLEYRQLQKLKSTYVDGMLACIDKGYLWTYWDQIGAATGRLSSYHPNIQAIPKTCVTITNYQDNFIEGKTDESKIDINAREPFISHDCWLLLAADFQQIELRLLAHLSNDPQLLEIFHESDKKDIFLTLTSQWLCKPYENISQSEREQTKRIVYSVMYGVGKDRLADYLKVSPDNAKGIMNSFLIKFPAVNRFTKSCIEFCKQHGYTSTLFGRRRYVPNINSYNPVLRAQAERQCVNFRVQGSAADLCKAAMIQVESKLRPYNTRLLVQIHDELVWEVPGQEIAVVKDIIKQVMENTELLCENITSLNVPLCITISTGTSWAHLTSQDKLGLTPPEVEPTSVEINSN